MTSSERHPLRMLCAVLLGAVLVCAEAEALDVTVRDVGRYQFITPSLNWTQAHTACKQMNGYLAVPETYDEANAISFVMETNDVISAHIGFHDLYEERVYVTVLDRPMAEMGFQQGAPNTSVTVGANCGLLRRVEIGSVIQPSYGTGACSTLRPAICQLRLWDDYTRIEDFGHYKVHSGSRVWTQAWATCRKESADLLVLRSEAEFSALYAAMRDLLSLRTFHYGGHHLYEEQRFHTIFDEPINWSGYARWLPGLPENLTNTAAPYMNVLFNDVDLHGLSAASNVTALPFICKHDLHRH